MILRFIFLLFLILNSSFAFSQSKDSLIKKTDIIYKNQEERSAFEQASFTNTDNLISILLSSYNKDNTYSDTKAKQQINDCIAKLKQETASRQEVKKVKYIYDYIHKSFLKVYKLQNSFADIFTKGEYNCVSASALYAIVFSKLDIPYTIIEAPQHVYLVAYPQTHKILIETTSPQNGYYQFNENFINQYVKSLYNSKLISKTEFDTSSVNKLFDRYYFSSAGLNLKELTGLQYSNYAVYYVEEKKYDDVVAEIKKAYFLNPGERNKHILKAALVYNVQNNTYDKKEQMNELALLCRFYNLEDKEISKEFIRNEFLRLTEKQLINNSNYTLYDESFNQISNEINDTILKNEIAYSYHYELSRLGYMNSKDSGYVLPHLRGAYHINPKNANLQAIILSYVEAAVKSTNDAKTVLKLMSQYITQFDFVTENNAYNGVKGNCLLELAYQHFAINDVVKGESYLKEFETLLNTKKGAIVNDIFIEKAYGFAAGIYYKKGNYARSKQTLKTGLVYSPGNFGLMQRLNQL